jgi:hypothetical protein
MSAETYTVSSGRLHGGISFSADETGLRSATIYSVHLFRRRVHTEYETGEENRNKTRRE